MKTIHLLFTAAMLLFGPSALSAADTNPATNAEAVTMRIAFMESFAAARSQSWMTNYYGETLSSLGDIVEVRIDRTIGSTPAWTHSDLWKIIEKSKVQELSANTHYHKFTFSPAFSIEYSSGMRVQATSSDVMIVLPDGRKSSAMLEVKP